MLKKELLRKEVEEKIRRNYPQDNLFNSFVLGNRVKKRIKGHSHVDLNKTEFYHKGFLWDQTLSIVFLIATIVYIIWYWKNIFESPVSFFFIISILLILTAVLFYQGFIQKNNPIVRFDSNGIRYNTHKYLFKRIEKKILWEEILVVKLWEIRHTTPIKKILIGKTNKEIEVIEITGLNTNPFEFVTLIRNRVDNVA